MNIRDEGFVVFVYAGAQLPSLPQLADNGFGSVLSPQLIVAFVLLGIFPIAVKKIMARILPCRNLQYDTHKGRIHVPITQRRIHDVRCRAGVAD